MFGDKLFPAEGKFPTPESVPEISGTRALCVPSNAAWFAVIMGCLMLLADEENWVVFDGGISAEAAAAVAQQIIDDAYDEVCATSITEIPTPFWDEVTDTDDEAPAATQTWYGYVDDPDLPAGELTFIEDAAIWAFTGFLALSGSPAAAITFHTIAPSFILAMRGDDFGEVIRVIIDGYEMATINTTGLTDELIEVPVYTDSGITPHEILLVLKEIL